MPIASPSWQREDSWGILKLLHASRDAVLWAYQIRDRGIEFPIQRHNRSRVLLSMTDGILLLQEFDDSGNQQKEQLLLTGDAYQIPAGQWYRMICMEGGTYLTKQQVPLSFDAAVCIGDVEEWKPPRIIGRG